MVYYPVFKVHLLIRISSFEALDFYLLKNVDNERCRVVVFRSCPRERIKQLKIIVDMQS